MNNSCLSWDLLIRINDVRFHSNFTLVFSWVIFGVLHSRYQNFGYENWEMSGCFLIDSDKSCFGCFLILLVAFQPSQELSPSLPLSFFSCVVYAFILFYFQRMVWFIKYVCGINCLKMQWETVEKLMFW